MSSVPSQERPEQPSTVTGSTAAQQPSVTPVEERPGPSAAVVPAPHQAVPETVIQMQTEEHGEHTPLLRGISRRTSLPELLIQGAQKRLRQISPPSRIQVGMELARAEAASGRPRPASVAVAAEASPIRTSATDSAAMTPDIPYIAPAGDGAPEAGGRRASIYEYIEYILTELAHPFDPKVPPVDVAARDQAEALKTIVNHIVADFQANKITVDRKAIRRIITRLVYSRISLPVLCAAFFRNSDNISWDVADNVITPLLQLTDASPTATTYTVPDDTQGFYLRSKSLSVTDAWLLIERFQKRFHHEVFVDKMIEMVKSARLQGKAIVHLRYIGMFETPASTPAVRLHQDLATTAALFAKVELCLQELAAADELDNNPQWAVYEFKSVRIPAQSSTDPLEGDLVERTLIALFGYDNLVNVQHGGFFASYAPSMADRQLFQGLNTSFGQTFAATAMVGRLTGNQFLFEGYPQTVYTAQVVAHFNNVSTFIRNNPSTLANMDYGERWNQFLIKSTIYQVF
ncbi:uncharacterized protein EV422DRAFT_339991 [Fimicolochytrium jonesii]|uniref:uncharacterized protein n=1 Tax=Fimicolochytrium jonesii TaxID=1396493 RepID=UPI0022FDDDD7|nr:uncharacterized protein EV422DRAFT_339991 [Fimicolochytrium jonesii]KAI8815886.1 hypothetical protein EV422DRAFT_339991 [Fimicolochytrium jonesii]